MLALSALFLRKKNLVSSRLVKDRGLLAPYFKQMIYLLIKTIITTLVILAVSEIAKRSSLLAGVIASIPLTTFLALIWLYWETKNIQKIIDLSNSVFLMVIPSLSFFIFLPFLLRLNISFTFSMLFAVVLTAFCYYIFFILVNKFSISGF